MAVVVEMRWMVYFQGGGILVYIYNVPMMAVQVAQSPKNGSAFRWRSWVIGLGIQ